MKATTPLSPEVEAELARLKPEEAGERIGPYKLLQQIGEGGFGVVWMAEQEQPVRRRVALKIIKLGMDTREVVARFGQERQALAMMDHPNIAKVFDAGATPTGRPYFVMELVRGIRITDYCDQANLPTAERLQLFIAVCHAVQHAHQKGIIHRDLKPSNILVTLHDGVPVPKVIDFGVAKATHQRLTDLTLFTQFEQMIGTPLYMSPEQAEMSGLDIDTRTDIYALGVLLYELLTGRPPFDPAALMKRGLDEMRRVIREEEPPRPSTALSTMAADAMIAVAQHRHCESAKLIGLLRGDLDWIVMKAIEKNRIRRYDTANAFADDIERHLTSKPVVARPPSTTYLLQKLARRHRTAFAAGSAVVLALLAGIAVSSWQAVRATHAEGLVGAERDRARTAEGEAKDQRHFAETAREVAEGNLYTAKMNLAQGAWERANVGRLREIIEETRTYPNRGFEWFYWQRQTHLELRTLRGHESTVRSVAFSPDGRQILTGSQDNTAKVWHAETGSELLTLKGHTGSVLSGAFSPDGRRIVTGSFDGIAKVWDAASGRELLTLKGHKAYDFSGEMHPANGWIRAPLTFHIGSVLSVAFSPDGRRIVTGSNDKTAKVWDSETGRELRTLNCPGGVRSVAFSQDARRIVTGLPDNTAKVWDMESDRELLTLKGHTRQINSIAFSPDGRRIVTGSDDRTAKVWDVKNGGELLTLMTRAERVLSVAFSPDGQRIVTGSTDNTAKVWDVDNGRELLTLKGHGGCIYSVAFSPDGWRILTGSEDLSAKVWDAEDRRGQISLKGHNGEVFSVALSPDGRRIVTGSEDHTAKVWDAETGREIITLKGHTGRVISTVFSPDGRQVVTGSFDANAKVWDAENGRELLTLKGHKYVVTSVAISPDGRRIVTGSVDNSAKVWDAKTGHELLTLEGPNPYPVTSVAFSPDGRRILMGSEDHTATMWDAESSGAVLILKGHKGWIRSVAFSSDGRRIVTGSDDRTAKVWDVVHGHELLTLKGHHQAVCSVAFSPDGHRIITGSHDRTAKLWDAKTGRELLTLKGNVDADYSVPLSSKPDLEGTSAEHLDAINSVAFSSDGRRIVTGSQDGTAKVWITASPEEVQTWWKEEQPAAK